MDSGIVSDGTKVPSAILKAKFLELLESNKSASMEDLAKVLKINTTLYAYETVQELVSSYEKRSGQLSLKKWKYIFRRLGFLDYFNQHVAADQRADIATDMDNVNCNPYPAARQQSRNDCDAPVGVDIPEMQDQSFDESRELTAASSCLPSLVNTRTKQTHGAIPKTRSAQQQNRADHDDMVPDANNEMLMVVTDGFSANQLAVSELELNLRATARATVGNVEETAPQNPSRWPEWSLPPLEQNQKKEKNATSDAPKGNNNLQDSVVEVHVAAESGFFSVEDNSHESRRMPSNIQLSSPAINVSPLSLVLEVDEPDVDAAASEIEENQQTYTGSSSLQTESNQQSGLHRSVAGACPPDNEGPDLNNGDRERGNPAEHYDTTENNGLLEELLKENESLRLNESFLVQKLREKETECADVQIQYYHLQHELEESRGACAQQQVTNEELTRRLEECTVLEAESQRLIRMTQEMCSWKEQERDRLEQHIRQMDQRYDDANYQIRENQDVSEELRLAVGEMQGLLQERELVRMDSERLLDERMAEVSQAFHNAETDEVKILKQKLRREKIKRKRTEERNKSLLKKIRQLQALSKKEGDVPSGDVEENHESSSATSSEEETDDQPGSSTYGQQSDSSEDSG